MVLLDAFVNKVEGHFLYETGDPNQNGCYMLKPVKSMLFHLTALKQPAIKIPP
jgi:hypothetical protein